MRYKVGDKVKVRENLTIGKFYKMNNSDDIFLYTLLMDLEKKKPFVIREVADNHYKVTDNPWYWTDEMLEYAEE